MTEEIVMNIGAEAIKLRAASPLYRRTSAVRQALRQRAVFSGLGASRDSKDTGPNVVPALRRAAIRCGMRCWALNSAAQQKAVIQSGRRSKFIMKVLGRKPKSIGRRTGTPLRRSIAINDEHPIRTTGSRVTPSVGPASPARVLECPQR